jgi:hypothetical protein
MAFDRVVPALHSRRRVRFHASLLQELDIDIDIAWHPERRTRRSLAAGGTGT